MSANNRTKRKRELISSFALKYLLLAGEKTSKEISNHLSKDGRMSNFNCSSSVVVGVLKSEKDKKDRLIFEQTKKGWTLNNEVLLDASSR